jgi:hypothetical protein
MATVSWLVNERTWKARAGAGDPDPAFARTPIVRMNLMHDYTLERCDAYALGTLDVEERTLVDEHLAACGMCSRAVGEAERVVSTMVEMTTPLVNPPSRLEERIERIGAAPTKLTLMRPGRSLAPWAALAAAVILSLGITTGHLWQENHSLQTMAFRTDAVLATIATSHFKHVSLTPRAQGVPPAKVLYAPDRSWIYLVVDAVACNCRLEARYGDGFRNLGAPRSNDFTSTLFVKNTGRPTSVRLIGASGEVIADADLQ